MRAQEGAGVGRGRRGGGGCVYVCFTLIPLSFHPHNLPTTPPTPFFLIPPSNLHSHPWSHILTPTHPSHSLSLTHTHTFTLITHTLSPTPRLGALEAEMAAAAHVTPEDVARMEAEVAALQAQVC